MALSANTVWEIRTTGAVTNGGGFVTGASGTDFSQQDAAQFALTGIASAGAGNVFLTATAAASMVGNILQVISGTNFTVGFFQITSVSVGVSVTCSTNNAGTAISVGVGANGVINIGGAVTDPAIVASSNAAGVAGMTVWQKAGTYTITSASTNVAGGCMAPGVRLTWEGYQTTRGDLGTKPLLQASGISTATLFAVVSAGFVLRNLELDGATLTAIRGLSNATGRGFFDLITVRNCTNNGVFCSVSRALFYRCLVTGCTTVDGAFISSAEASAFSLCVAQDNTVTGFLVSGAVAVMFSWCIADTNTGATSDGFSCSLADGPVSNCVAYANGRDGFRASSASVFLFTNCLAESNGAFGFTSSGSGTGFGRITCATFGNSSGATSGTFQVDSGNVTGSGSFFTNAAAGDFSLNNTAGAGASARAAGLPGVYPGGLTTGYLDIGAAQHQDPASAGGGGSVFGALGGVLT